MEQCSTLVRTTGRKHVVSQKLNEENISKSNKLSDAADMSSKMRTDIFSNTEVISDLNKRRFGWVVGVKTWSEYKRDWGQKKLSVRIHFGTSLVVQWLGLHTFTAEGTGSIPGQGTKIPQAAQRSQKKFICKTIG